MFYLIAIAVAEAKEYEDTGFWTGWFYAGFYTFLLSLAEVTLEFQEHKTTVYTVIGEVKEDFCFDSFFFWLKAILFIYFELQT